MTYNFRGGSKPKRSLEMDSFKGVDFTTNPLNISPGRSPDALNVIGDLNGQPVCRPGFELFRQFEGAINGIYVLTLANSERILIHHGVKISLLFDGVVTELYDKCSNVKSSGTQMDDKLYLFDGVKALVYGEYEVLDPDGIPTGDKEFLLKTLSEAAYVPTTTIGRASGSGMGGTPYEKPNLLTNKRKNSFLVKTAGSNVLLQLDTAPILAEGVKVKNLTSEGNWVDVVNFTVDTTKGQVKLASAVATPVTGMDNYEVEFDVGNKRPKHLDQVYNQNTGSLPEPVDKVVDQPFELDNHRPWFHRLFYEVKLKYSDLLNPGSVKFMIPGHDMVKYQWFAIKQNGGEVITKENYKQYDGTWLDARVYTKLEQRGSDWILTITAPYFYYYAYGSSGDILYHNWNNPFDQLWISYDYLEDSYVDRINLCNVVQKYGFGGNADRLFVSGNPDMRNYDWWSDFEKPNYFPDLNYAKLGDEDTAIMGYSWLADGSLAIHKEFNGQDSSIYIRTADTLEGEVVFPVRQGAVGMGVVAKRAFGYLGNEPLALSQDGVFATVPVENIAVNERYAQLRSYFVNGKLRQESDLKAAEAIVFGNKYYLAVGGRVYVADGDQKTYANKGNEYSYEWYLWDNMPVSVWWIYQGELCFGTVDGQICKLNSSCFDLDKPIECYWTTPILNFGTDLYYKKIKQVLAVSPPYSNCKLKLEYLTPKYAKAVKDISIVNTEFDRFPVNTPSNYKAKKVMYMQFRLSGNPGEPFGLYGLSVMYTIGGKYK